MNLCELGKENLKDKEGESEKDNNDDTTEENVPTSAPAGSICAIDKGVVHQICSGQVVLTLSTAVKELLENSIDAGATVVDIRLVDHGSTLIEVTDNGSGVEEENFAGLTMKHHTSKLRQFTDLFSVETFGFRGEALSSLCALSDVSISTRHLSSSTGSSITYDHDGKEMTRNQVARTVGTTVKLANVFSTMPVRQKEFQRNLKKEFARLVSVVSAYGLVSSDLRLTCSNTVGQGKKSVVVQTSGQGGLSDNITNIFGSKQMSSLVPVKQIDLTDSDIAGVRIEGFVSSPVHGEGRGAPDRQFFFINGRPCDPSRLTKVVNQVYHSYNRSQFPFVFLNILTERRTVDVNITPDKRQVFLQHEKLMVDLVKRSLEKMFSDAPSTMTLTKIGQKQDFKEETGQEKLPKSISSKLDFSSLKRRFSSTSCSDIHESPQSLKRQKTLDNFVKVDLFLSEDKIEITKESTVNCEMEVAKTNPEESVKKLDSLNNGINLMIEDPRAIIDGSGDVKVTFSDLTKNEQTKNITKVSQKGEFKVLLETPSVGEDKSIDANILHFCELKTSQSNGVKVVFDELIKPQHLKNKDIIPNASQYSGLKVVFDELLKSPLLESKDDVPNTSQHHDVKVAFDDIINPSTLESNDDVHNVSHCKGVKVVFDDLTSYPSTQASNANEHESVYKDNTFPNKSLGINLVFEEFDKSVDSNFGNDKENPIIKQESVKLENGDEAKLVVTEEDASSSERRKKREVKINFSVDKLGGKGIVKDKDSIEGGRMRFKAQIKPTDNKSAEAELQKQLLKSDFQHMQIYGQFNLGFLIVGLVNDLFIIDQHATDEKYNFETLQETTVIKSQKMVVPQKLELTAVNESILIDNVEVFEKNGFEFDVDTDAPVTQRVKLASLPISKNWTFGKEDIDELIFMLSEGAGDIGPCRPSRVRSMFAMRACRSSIMVGTSLARSDMERLVRHMGEIDQPWNCPHGRPTIRHLINTDMIQ